MLRPNFRRNKKADAFQDIHVLRLHLDILSNGFRQQGKGIPRAVCFGFAQHKYRAVPDIS
jgi:hypothetical protein